MTFWNVPPLQILKGKLHGSLDVSLAVMSINKKSKRIDLDAGDSLYHMKVRGAITVLALSTVIVIVILLLKPVLDEPVQCAVTAWQGITNGRMIFQVFHDTLTIG